jgi:hypothetical protein
VAAKKKTAKEDFANATHLLLGALKVTPPQTHPPRPFHMGGPPPKLDALAYVHAAIWLAEKIDRHVDPRDRAEFDEHVALGKRQLARSPEERRKKNEDTKALHEANAAKLSRIPAKIGAWVAHEALNFGIRPIYAGGAARPSAANFARFLSKKDPQSIPQFLRDLDRRCVHFEAIAILHERDSLPKRAAVTETIWRGHKDGKVTHWLMHLTDGSFALLFKEKTRWQLYEGPRDEVLAHITDEHQFTSAVNAATTLK